MDLALLWAGLIFMVIGFMITANQFLETRHYVYTTILGSAVACLIYFVKNIYDDPNGHIWDISGYLGAIFLMFGWIYPLEHSTINTRKNHTLSTITGYMFSELHESRMDLINKRLGGPVNKISQQVCDYTDTTDAVIRAIDRELNYLEYMSIGILHKDMDEKIARAMMGTYMIFFYDQMEDYIIYWQKTSQEVWNNFAILQQRWREDSGK